MSQFATLSVNYAGILDAAIKSSGSWLAVLNNPRLGKPTSGAVSVPIKTAVTLQSPSDGTMLGNNAARTLTALTAFWGIHTVSLESWMKDAYDEAEDDAEARAFLGASRIFAEKEIITDLVAGTASTTATLTVGQLNFSTDGTAGEINDNLQKLDTTRRKLMANVAGSAGRVFGITTPTGLGNIEAMTASLNYGQIVQVGNDIDMLMYRGQSPIFAYNGASVSGFGTAASADAFYWVHPDAEALTWTDMQIPHDDLRKYGDGFWKKFFEAFGFAGLIQSSHFATISNGTS